MKRTLTINGRVGRYDVPFFVWANNKNLKIKIKANQHSFGQYVAVITCGEEKQTIYLNEEMTILVSSEFIQRGGFHPLYITLELRESQGTVNIISGDSTDQNSFLIEPLLIERVKENITAQGWMSCMEKKMDEMQVRLKLVEEKLAKFEDEGVPLLPENE